MPCKGQVNLTNHHSHTACYWHLIEETQVEHKGKRYSISWSTKCFLLYPFPPFLVHITLYVCMREKQSVRQRDSVCVYVQDTEMLMPLLWALSSTLSVSVYNAKWEKVPVIPRGLKAGESGRKTGARGTLFCFGKACRRSSEGHTHLIVKSQRVMS